MIELAPARRAGLELDAHEDEDGTWSAILTNSKGEAVWNRAGYKNIPAAKGGASYWITNHYRRQNKAQQPPPMTSAGGKGLLRQLRQQAQDNEKEAARLYEMAELLGQEAKRLTAAADVLEASYE